MKKINAELAEKIRVFLKELTLMQSQFMFFIGSEVYLYNIDTLIKIIEIVKEKFINNENEFFEFPLLYANGTKPKAKLNKNWEYLFAGEEVTIDSIVSSGDDGRYEIKTLIGEYFQIPKKYLTIDEKHNPENALNKFLGEIKEAENV